MDLSQIVNNFSGQNAAETRRQATWLRPKAGSENSQETVCHHPTPASSPTAESDSKMSFFPLEPPLAEGHYPIEGPQPSHAHLALQGQGAAPVWIPVISSVAVRGVYGDQTSEVFNCDICKKDFKRKSGLIRHNMIHLGIRPNQCEVCDKRFLQKSALKVHYRIHSGEKPYTCKHCGRKFGDSSSLCRHYRMHKSKGEYSNPTAKSRRLAKK